MPVVGGVRLAFFVRELVKLYKCHNDRWKSHNKLSKSHNNLRKSHNRHLKCHNNQK